MQVDPIIPSPWNRSEQSLTADERDTGFADQAVDLRAHLESGLDALSLTLGGRQIDHLLAYLGQMLRWNKTYNLTAIRQPSEMVVMHLLDSLSVLPIVNRHMLNQRHLHLVDVGTGAGLPGIPLKLARPDLRLTLIETNGKKAAFLRHIQASLGLADTEVCQARVESLSLDTLANGSIDVLTCRAFRAMKDLLDLVAPLIGPDTTVIAMKGPAAEQELAMLKQSFEQQSTNQNIRKIQKSHGLTLEPLKVPGLDAERAAVVMAPYSKTGMLETITNQE